MKNVFSAFVISAAFAALFAQTPATKQATPAPAKSATPAPAASKSGTPAATTKAPATATKAPATATKAPAPAAKAAPGDLLKPATWKLTAPATFRAKLTTSKGDVIVEVTRAWAPLGADRFYNMVRSGYLNGCSFFRVVPGFVVQFGISGKPDVARAWQNANLFDEPVKTPNKRGTLVYARAGANTRSTQLFINLGDNLALDTMNGFGFPPFGQVVEGMEIVEKIYAGYGEQPDQGQIFNQGQPYLDRNFPNLDKIVTATIMPAAPAAAATPAAAPAATPAKAADTKK